MGAPRVHSTQLLEPIQTGIRGRGWSVCSVLLHRVVLTNGPLLRADASDPSSKNSSLTGGVIVLQPPQSVTRLLVRLKKCNVDLQLCKLSTVFSARRSDGRKKLANNNAR